MAIHAVWSSSLTCAAARKMFFNSGAMWTGIWAPLPGKAMALSAAHGRCSSNWRCLACPSRVAQHAGALSRHREHNLVPLAALGMPERAKGTDGGGQRLCRGFAFIPGSLVTSD